MRIRLADRPEDVEPSDVGHAQVDHHQVGATDLHLRYRLLSSRTCHDVEAGAPREAPDDVENALLVVDDQKERSLPSHTYSLATARITERSARS